MPERLDDTWMTRGIEELFSVEVWVDGAPDRMVAVAGQRYAPLMLRSVDAAEPMSMNPLDRVS